MSAGAGKDFSSTIGNLPEGSPVFVRYGGGRTLRGVTWKSGPVVKSSIFSANIRPTETYYIPNQWKLIKVFDELCRFKITALIE